MVFTFLPLVFLLLILEGGARIVEFWRPAIPTDFGLGFSEESRLFVPRPGFPGHLMTNPNKAISTNYVGKLLRLFTPRAGTVPFLWQSFTQAKPEKSFRIFFLGGSSVNYAQEQLQSMARRLEERFPEYARIELINCGGCAYGSHRLVHVLMEILNYDPDAVFLYLGHNEFEEQEQLRFARLRTVPLQKMLSRSAFLRLVRDWLALRQLKGIQDKRNEQIMAGAVVSWHNEKDWRVPREQIVERMNAFRENLETMVTTARSRDLPVVIGTIPSNLIAPNLIPEDAERYATEVLPKFADGQYEEGRKTAQEILMWASRHQSSDLENEIVREVARKHGVPLADVEKRIIEAEPHHVPGETLFGDHCHLNEQGRVIMAQEYEERAVEVLQGMAARGR